MSQKVWRFCFLISTQEVIQRDRGSNIPLLNPELALLQGLLEEKGTSASRDQSRGPDLWLFYFFSDFYRHVDEFKGDGDTIWPSNVANLTPVRHCQRLPDDISHISATEHTNIKEFNFIRVYLSCSSSYNRLVTWHVCFRDTLIPRDVIMNVINLMKCPFKCKILLMNYWRR